MRASARVLVLLLTSALLGGCGGPPVDLEQALQIDIVSTGWYDVGIVDGKNKLVPTVSFTVKNLSQQELVSLQMMASFFRVNDTSSEWGNNLVKAAGSAGLAPGATTPSVDDSIAARLYRHRAARGHAEEFTLRRCHGQAGREVRGHSVDARQRGAYRAAARHAMKSSTARASAATSPSLERRLGPFDAAAIVVSNVIGGGILFVPIIVAGLISDARAILFVWALGGALAFAGAMAYAELAALRPRAGGEYVYLRDAYGPAAGFLSGWTSFVAGFSGAIAASAIALADYTGRFVPAAADATPLLTVPIPLIPLIVSPKTLVALTAIVVLTLSTFAASGWDAWCRTRWRRSRCRRSSCSCCSASPSDAAMRRRSWHQGTSGSTAILLALIPIMFTYSGWNAGAYVAEEVRDPERNVPLALGIGTLAVIVIYLSLNALYLYALPVSELASVPGGARLIDTVAERLFGFAAGGVFAAFSIVSLAASMSAMMIAGPRVYFAMARDGVFASTAGEINAKSHAPAHAIIAQAIWSGVLVLSGTLSQLVNYTGFAVVLFSAAAVAAVFVLAPPAAGPAAAVQRLGLSVGAGDLRDRQRADAGECDLEQPGDLARRPRGHRGGYSRLLVDDAGETLN